jgi:hypothetical protein
MKTIGQLTVATPGASTLALSAVARSRTADQRGEGNIVESAYQRSWAVYSKSYLSEAAAVQLGMIADGVANLRVSRFKMS